MTYISWSSGCALLMPWRLFHVWTSLFGIMNKYDLMHHLEINVGHRDLYVTIQWFCLVSWRQFHVQVWTSLFGILNQYDPTHLLKINVGHCDLYFMVQWFCYILKTIWCMNIILGDCRSIWPVVWLPNKSVSLWPLFHGPLILPYISKTILWMRVIFFR